MPGMTPQAERDASAALAGVAPRYFETLRTPVVAGREFDWLDGEAGNTASSGALDPSRPRLPAIVNEAFARRFLGGKTPLDSRFGFNCPSQPSALQIIGVVADAKYGNVRDTIWPTVYAPIGDWNGDMYFEVRTATDPKALIPEIQSAISRFDSHLLIVGMKTETEQIDQDLYQERLISALSGIFAALALIVACVGLYGLLAFQVARRTQEIGIRLALGAERGDVLQLVLAEGAGLAIAGTLIGCAAALFLNRYLESFVFGIKPTDAMTVIAVAVLLIGVAVMASYVPARRAAKVDPMVALRYE